MEFTIIESHMNEQLRANLQVISQENITRTRGFQVLSGV